MHDIAHKDIHRGEDQPNAQAENEQHNNGIHRQQHRAQRNMGPGNQRYKEERHQAEKEVNQRKAAFFQWKNVLGDIDLAQQRAVFQHAFHRHAGGFAKEVDRMNRLKDCLDGDTLLDNCDLAQLLGVTQRTIARYREKGLIRYYQTDENGKNFYRSSEIQDFLRQRGKKK